jgi:hypothetical protein
MPAKWPLPSGENWPKSSSVAHIHNIKAASDLGGAD